MQPNLSANSTTWLVTGAAGYRVFKIGNNQPTPLMDYIQALERALGLTVKKNDLPMQPGVVPATSANIDELDAWVRFKPNTAVQAGVTRFMAWYRSYYNV